MINAIRRGDDVLLEALLAQSPRYEPNVQRLTPLHVAVQLGNRHAAQRLLEAGARVDRRDLTARTPLLYAVQRNDAALVTLLAAYGANVDGEQRAAPLHAAVRAHAPNALLALLAAGADKYVRDAREGNAMQIAATVHASAVTRVLQQHEARVVVDIAVGLAAKQLPALVLLAIADWLMVRSFAPSDVILWDIAATAKHFHERRQQD